MLYLDKEMQIMLRKVQSKTKRTALDDLWQAAYEDNPSDLDKIIETTQCDPSLVHPDFKSRAIDAAACRGNIGIMMRLQFKHHVKLESSPDQDKHLLYWITECDDSVKREMMLQWYYDNKLWVKEGITEAHVLWSMGKVSQENIDEEQKENIINEIATIPDKLGLTPLYYYYRSGLQKKLSNDQQELIWEATKCHIYRKINNISLVDILKKHKQIALLEKITSLVENENDETAYPAIKINENTISKKKKKKKKKINQEALQPAAIENQAVKGEEKAVQDKQAEDIVRVALFEAIKKGDIIRFNQLSKTIDCSVIHPKFGNRPIDWAAAFGRVEIVEALVKLPHVTIEYCPNEQNKSPEKQAIVERCDENIKHLLYWICLCKDPQSRQRMLQWLLKDDHYKTLEPLGVTKAHVLAALGLYDPSAPAETLYKPCCLGFTPLHLFYLSGYQFAEAETTSTYACIKKEEVIAQFDKLYMIEEGQCKGRRFEEVMFTMFDMRKHYAPIISFYEQMLSRETPDSPVVAGIVNKLVWLFAKTEDKKDLERLDKLIDKYGQLINLNYAISNLQNSIAVLLSLNEREDEQIKNKRIVKILKRNPQAINFESYEKPTGLKLKALICRQNLVLFSEIMKTGQACNFSSDIVQFDIYTSQGKPIPECFKQYQDFPFLFDVILYHPEKGLSAFLAYCDSLKTVNKEECDKGRWIDLNVKVGKNIEDIDQSAARCKYAGYTAAYLIAQYQGWTALEKILKKFPQAIDLTVKPEGEKETLLDLIEKSPVYNKVIALQSEKTKREIEKIEQEKLTKLNKELTGDVKEKKNTNQQSAPSKTKKHKKQQQEQEQRKAQKLKESEESEQNQKDRKSEQAQRKKEIEIAQQEAAKRIAEEKKKEKEKQGNKEKEKPYLTDWLGQKKLSNIETWSKEALNDPSFGPMNIVWLLKKLAKRRTTWDEAKEIGLLKFLNLKKIRDKLQHIDLQKKQDQKAICNIAFALYLLNFESAWLKESGFGDMLAEKIIELTKRLPEVTPRDGRFAASSGRTEQLDTESMQVVTKYQPADKTNIFAARQILQAYYWFGYNIVLMSELPKNDETKAKLGTIYLLPTTGEYLLRNGEEIIHGKINTTTLHLDFANNNVLAKQINHPDCKSSILQQISHTGRIHWTLNLPNACMEKLRTIVESDPKPDSSNSHRNFSDRLKKLLLGEDRITFKEEVSFKNIAFADIYIKDKITGEKFVIEIDGPDHESKVEVDEARDRMFMERFGVTAVLRITTEEKEMLDYQNDAAFKEFLVNKGIPTALFKNNLNYTETSHGMFANYSPVTSHKNTNNNNKKFRVNA